MQQDTSDDTRAISPLSCCLFALRAWVWMEDEPVYVRIGDEGDEAYPVLPQKRTVPTAPGEGPSYYIPIATIQRVERRRRCRACACSYLSASLLLLLVAGLMTIFFMTPRAPVFVLTELNVNMTDKPTLTAQFEALNYNYYGERFSELSVSVKGKGGELGTVDVLGPLDVMARDRRLFETKVTLSQAGEAALRAACGGSSGGEQGLEVAVVGSVAAELAGDSPLQRDFGRISVQSPLEWVQC